jgi:glycosyltransferase involved in cell wall biosynthesis
LGKKSILIDATPVTKQVDGLSHYIINLIKYLPSTVFDLFDVTVLVNNNVDRPELQELFLDLRLNKLIFKIAPAGPKRDFDFLRFKLKYAKKFDIFHCTCNWYPVFFRNGITTVHDITYKKAFDAGRFKMYLVKWYMDFALRNALKNANIVVAVSQSTKNELQKYFSNAIKKSDKIKVVYEGWEHIIQTNRDVANQSFEHQNYFLYVGSSRVHKNLLGLLKAYKIYITQVNKSYKLVITGDMRYLNPDITKLISAINVDNLRVIVTGYVSDDELHHIYNRAKAFIFPSFSEGFGIPVLEAFYHGKPLLCSNTTSLPEVAGNAALYFDPYSPANIAEQMTYFTNHNDISTDLVNRGKKQLELFSWKKCGEEIEKLYQSFL